MDYNTTSYESFYSGSPSALAPEYGAFGSIGKRMSAAKLGFPGSPQTANQLGETVNALKQGVKVFEVSLLGVQDADQAIPKQHFEEMRALMKLSGVKPSVHGPLVDAAGFGEKGWGGDEAREDNERKMFSAIEKAHMLDPQGNTPIVFHASNGVPGAEFRPGDVEKGEDRFIVQRTAAINQDTKQIMPLEREYKYRPGAPHLLKKGGMLFKAEDQLEAVNAGAWEEKLTGLTTMSKNAGELIGNSPKILEDFKEAAIDLRTGKMRNINTGGEMRDLDPEKGEAQAYNQMKGASIFLENAELSFKGAFHQAYKYGTPEQKKQLEVLSDGYAKNLWRMREVQGIQGKEAGIRVWSPVERKQLLDQSIRQLASITDRELGGGTPQIFKEAEKFAMEKAADTFGGLAMKSYKKFGKSAPIIAIENMYQGMGFSRAKDMKALVERSRKDFIGRLKKEKGISGSQAKQIADKQIGVTWDVGHLNVLRKTGFGKEDIVKETKTIAPMVKHVHLTDNFGYSDSHLAPGMGNVPFKDILEELEKTGRLGEMKKIVEAGSFVQHFKKSPHPGTLAAFGSPIYGMQMGSYWNQVADVFGGYFGGYGTLNPQQHHTMYGAGFTTMPVELGGQMPGNQSRVGGTPMA
jgi:hypothetical protein